MEKELLGKGRFGEVYKVTKDDEAIALKEIIIEAKNKEKALILGLDSTEELEEKTQEVMKEISFLNDLKGDSHIVNYIDYYVDKTEDQYTLSIEMELLKQLDSIHDGILDEKDIKALLDDMLDALAVLEAHHIVHGDIKPSNIMVDDYGNYKLTDFGISKILGQKLVGYTKAYAPKEVLEEGRYTSSSDLYSLGLVIYQMFNKNLLPFMKDKDDLDSIHNRFKEELPRPEGMDNDFYEFLKTALNNNPEERYFSAKAMKNTLDYLYKENHIPAITISVTELLLIVSKLSITNIKGMEVKVLSEAIKTTAKAATGSAVKKGIITKIASLPVLAKAGITAALVVSGIGGGYVINEKVNPSYDDLIVSAQECISNRDYDGAFEYLNKAKDKDSKRYEAYEDMTKIYITQDKGQKALNTLKEAKNNLSKENYQIVEQYEKPAYYDVYKNYVKQLESEYGKYSIQYEDDYLSYLNGLSFLYLSDYDNDGVDELTAICTENANTTLKVYTYSKNDFNVISSFDQNADIYDNEIAFSKGTGGETYLAMYGNLNGDIDIAEYSMKNTKFSIINQGFDNLNSYDGGRFRDLVTYPLFDPVGDTTDSYYSPTIQQIENVKNTLDLTTTVSFDISQKKQSNKSNKIDYSLYKSYVDEALSSEEIDAYNYDSKGSHIFYDIDNDGIKELGINYCPNLADNSMTFYKIKNNSVMNLGTLQVSRAFPYIDKKSKCLVFIDSQALDDGIAYSKTTVTIKNDKLETKNKNGSAKSKEELHKNLSNIKKYTLLELEDMIK